MSANTNMNAQIAFKKMEELKDHMNPVPEFDMIKFLDTYKRSVDFYNSYGLDSAPSSTRHSRQSTERMTSNVSSFWDLN